ncbi:MAG: hypothetical protein NTX29_03570 [Actinobacteria bacterium]|nr:hypothetical protein [Actinomycetota bacterium]
MDIAFLAAYLILPVLAYLRARSVAWVVIAIAGSAGVFGALISFAIDRGHDWTRIELQWTLLVVLAVVTVIAWIWPFRGTVSFRRQALAILLPVAVLLLVFFVITTFWTDGLAFLKPVSYLIGHSTAEDNAKWLDFTSQFAAGQPIQQAVPMGGPLELMLTFIGTLMGVISLAALGGYNEVAVAANSVVYGQFILVALVPLALAPLAEAKLRAALSGAPSDPPAERVLIPAPFIWIAAGVLATISLVVTGYGHMTFQFTLIVAGLWSATFLALSSVPRARLITSLAAAASMTVWLPLNVVAIVVVIGWGVVLLSRGFRFGWRSFDGIGFALLAVVTVGVFQPVYSSMVYLVSGTAPSASGAIGGGGAGGIAAGAAPHAFGLGHFGLTDSTLFAANGGTDQAGPILALLAVSAAFVASIVVSRQAQVLRTSAARRFIPLGMLAFFAVIIYSLDFWSTGSGPHYGSMKFTFLVAALALGTCLPLALMLIDPQALGRMTASRWIAIAGIVVLLMVDSVLPRAIALARPDQWSPPIPFENTSGSYWWPADVNGTGTQPIADSPVACVYLPQGATVPSAILASQLSDPQRVYSCTRILAGLTGEDTGAQPLVDWLRREWFSNTPAWSPVYDSLAGMPESVQNKPVILLDDGSNVIGIETVRSLLARFPQSAGDAPQ